MFYNCIIIKQSNRKTGEQEEYPWRSITESPDQVEAGYISEGEWTCEGKLKSERRVF